MQERSILLVVFGAFIIFANLPRFLPIAYFPNHLSVVELALYLISAGAIWHYRHGLGRMWVFPVCILCSTSYGIFLHDLDLPGVLYGCKLLAMLVSGWAVGKTLAVRFGENLQEMANWLLRLYTYHLAIGILLFAFFPNAMQLFNFLKTYGLVFTGDPHSFRFFSPYFDPNFYATLTCIPLLLLRHVGKKRPILSLLFWGSVALTFSRSGIATCLLVFGFLSLQSKAFRIHSLMISLGILSIICLFPESLVYFLNRLIHFFEDPSALSRLYSLQAGWNAFMEKPLFGWGYNFLSKSSYSQSLVIDSSLLQTLADFGLIFTLGLLISACIWSLNRFSLYKGTKFAPIFKELYLYVLVAVIFSSLFNNILYFQFWLIPVVAIFTYLENARKIMYHSRLVDGDGGQRARFRGDSRALPEPHLHADSR